MTMDEIVRVLRYCGNGGACDACCHPNPGEHREYEWRCLGPLLLHTASQIERGQKEIDELRKEIEWKDMVIALAQRKQAEAEAERDAALADLADARSCKTCKYACDTRDCSSCKSKTCKCLECHLDKNAWEWRGLPEAPEEGEKA